jgi:hypothetical protein
VVPDVSDSTAKIMPCRPAGFAPPTLSGALLFEAKAFCFKARRLVKDVLSGPAKLSRTQAQGAIAGQSRTPLWGDTRLSERAMQWGKVHNLRVAAKLLDGTYIPADETFSFWKQLGRPVRTRGFTNGRMLREGCLVPSAGGGLCQLSNALYDAALQAGCEIVERHGHSRIVPGSSAALDRDATVAWNYVDLRFRASQPLTLRVTVERDTLNVRLEAARVSEVSARVAIAPAFGAAPAEDVEDCDSCAETSCFRHELPRSAPVGRTAYLVDESWPEFRMFVTREKKDGDVLGFPLDGVRWHMPRYGWRADGFANSGTATIAALARSLAQRSAEQGPARRDAELRGAERIARKLGGLLTPDVTDVVVAQSLLPFLWREGHLGGRKFSVLPTRLPMAEIQARLDAAARAHPERKTLSDFRCDPALLADEAQAFAAADQIVTPHTEVAHLFGERAVLLDWQMPARAPRSDTPVRGRIAFPGPTVARKGAYELREAAKALNLEVVLLGNELEGPDFWSGIRTRKPDPADPFAGVCAVVQPALLEEAPRRLLMALARGIPVIATPACGLPPRNGLMLASDDALIDALRPYG